MRHNTVSHLEAACAHRPSQRPPWNCWLRSLGSQKKKMRHFIKLSFDNTRSFLTEHIDNIEAALVMAVASSRARIVVLNSAPPRIPIVGLGSSADYLYLGPGRGFYASQSFLASLEMRSIFSEVWRLAKLDCACARLSMFLEIDTPSVIRIK